MSDFVISKNQNWFSKLCWFWGYQNFGPIPWEFDFGILHEFLKMRRWRWYAWANPYQNLRKCIELYLQQVELIEPWSLFDFSSTHAISTHVKSNFCVVFNIELFSASSRGNVIGIKRCGIFLRIFLSIWKVCRKMSTYPNAHANAKKGIFDIQYPGNQFEFGIILNDFWSSTIWDHFPHWRFWFVSMIG